MKFRNSFLALTISLAALCLAGCASHPPILEEKAAESALDAAEPLAQTYASELFLDAQKTFDNAKLEVETQNASAGFSQSFADAKQGMIDARTKAEEALRTAQANQQQARTDTEAGLAALDAGLVEAGQVLASVKKTRSSRSARNQFKTELETLTTSIEESRLLISDETYLQALEMIQEFQTRLSELRTGVDELAGVGTAS
jgi:hypothetical protein